MNGVRRFLGSATSSPKQQHDQPDNPPSSLPTVVPLSFSAKAKQSSSPLTSSSPLLPEASPKLTPSLIINKKERSKQGSLSQSTSFSLLDDPSGSSPNSTPLKPALMLAPRSHAAPSPQRPQTMPNSSASDMSSVYSSNSRRSDPGWQKDSGNLTTRDELLMSLMASEAVIDCREFSILGTEEFEELKKEHQVLSSRLVAMNRKLALETKIRDAALNLSRVNAAHKKISKQTSEQLEAANNRVEAAQKELWRISEKSNEVYRRLMEHRAGVLSYSLRNLEAKTAANSEDSEYDSWNRSTLVGSVSPFTTSSTTLRFDGAHLFAGHADAVVPRPKLSTDAAIAEIAKVEEKLKEAKDQLAAARKKQTDMARELSMVKLEKEEVETTLGMDLQAAEETITALEKEIPRLEEINLEVQRLRQEKSAWEMERVNLEVLMEQSPAKVVVEAGVSALKSMIQDFGLALVSHEPSLLDLLDTVATHLRTMHAKLEECLEAKAEWESMKGKLEDGVRVGLGKQESLARELEEVRKERDTVRRSPSLDIQSRSPGHLHTPSSEDGDFSLSNVTAVLQPIWAILPSPEGRAMKLGANTNKNYRTGSPVLNNSSTTASSLSELDVRALKTLYDTRQQGSGGPTSSPNPGSEPFSIEAFAQRVQALVNDDRALIERLIRFAQAHDLLKKNAERAQKLAQDGNSAMETYQKQVKILEERNMSLSVRYSTMQEEIDVLQDTIERMTADKHELEGLAAEQAEQILQLTEANNALSAKTLQLAEDAAQAPEMVRRQMETQLSDLKKQLEAAEGELLAIKTSEQSQRIILLDELNTMQTENSKLMAQLRAVKR